MKTLWTLFAALALISAPVLADDDEEEVKKEWDRTATAESLGLEPMQLPDDFFPIYAWGGMDGAWNEDMTDPETYEKYDSHMKSQYDCKMTMPGFISDEQVPLCEKYGMPAILDKYEDLEEHMQQKGYSPYIATLKQSQADELVKEMVESTKDDPNVLGYYIIDEPCEWHFQGLGKIVAAMKKYAPGKFAYINLYPDYAPPEAFGVDTFEDYLELYVQEVKPQYICYDNYAIEISEDMAIPGGSIAYWTSILTTRKVAQKYGLPWWVIVSSIAQLPDSTPPGPTRYALQSYAALAAGVRGIGWFLYRPCIGFDMTPCDKKWNKSVSWGYLRTVNEQIQNIGTYLNKFHSDEVWFTSPAPAPDLPENPQKLVKEVKCQFSEQIKDQTPQLMVGEFSEKEGTKKAVMFVNLNYGYSVKIEPEFIGGEYKVRMISAMDKSEQKEPEHGWWILPGHGLLLQLSTEE